MENTTNWNLCASVASEKKSEEVPNTREKNEELQKLIRVIKKALQY